MWTSTLPARHHAEHGIQKAGILPRAIHCELNTPLHGVHRHGAHLRERQRIVISGEVLDLSEHLKTGHT